MRLLDTAAFLERYHATGLSVELRSSPGIGKSSVVRQTIEKMARRLGVPVGLITVMLTSYSDVDTRGFLIPYKAIIDGIEVHRARFTMPDYFPQVAFPGAECFDPATETWRTDMEQPALGVVFLDELAQAGLDVKKAVSPLILEGKMGNFTLPDGWVVWAASNRAEDKAGVTKDLSHLDNRRMLINIVPDVASTVDWMEKNEVHPLTIAFTRKNPGVVLSGKVPEKNAPYCTPRSLVLMSETLMAMREDPSSIALPNDAIATEVASGWIGEGAAAQFMSFASVADEVPDIEDVIADPMGTKLPERPDALFVTAYFIAGWMDEDNIEPLAAYIDRMSPEYQVAAWRAALARDNALQFTEQFSDIATKHGDLLMSVMY